MDIQVIARAGHIVGILLLLISGVEIARSETTATPVAQNSITNNANPAAQSSTASPAIISAHVQRDATYDIEQLVRLEARKRVMCNERVVALDTNGQPDPALKSILCGYESAKSPGMLFTKKAVEVGKPSTVFAVSLKNWQWTHSPESEAKLIQGLVNKGVEEQAAKPFITTALNAARSSIGKRVQSFILVSSATAIVFEFLNDDEEPKSNQTLRDLLSGKTPEEIAAEQSIREAEAAHRRWLHWGIVVAAGLIGVVVYSALKGRVFT